MIRSTILITTSLAVVAPAFAQEAPTTPAPDPDKKICRMITPTGSIMGKQFCLTKAEWKKLNQINSDSAETAMAARRMSRPKGSDDY